MMPSTACLPVTRSRPGYRSIPRPTKWVLTIALAQPAAGVESPLAARLANATDDELVAELATATSGLERFEIARVMARRGAGRFVYLWGTQPPPCSPAPT
jgi:hypothetical protein